MTNAGSTPGYVYFRGESGRYLCVAPDGNVVAELATERHAARYCAHKNWDMAAVVLGIKEELAEKATDAEYLLSEARKMGASEAEANYLGRLGAYNWVLGMLSDTDDEARQQSSG